MSVSEISRRLKITRQTITRLRKINKLKNQGFSLAVKKVNQDRMAKEINAVLLGLAKGTAEVFFNWRIKPLNDYPGKKL